MIAKNKRRFLGFSEDDSGFDPNRYRGRIVITTMHKAKGLEWDRVYLLSVNNYDFPSGMPYDQYISEKWFIREQLNLEAEALAQLTRGPLARTSTPGTRKARPPRPRASTPSASGCACCTSASPAPRNR